MTMLGPCARRTWILLGVLACACAAAAPNPPVVPAAAPTAAPVAAPAVTPPVAARRPCAELELEPGVTVIVDGSSSRLSGQEVVADGFMMRWVEREPGVSEHLASVQISTRTGSAIATQRVGIGAQVVIGTDRYCVTEIDHGRSGPGSVSLQKLASPTTPS